MRRRAAAGSSSSSPHSSSSPDSDSALPADPSSLSSSSPPPPPPTLPPTPGTTLVPAVPPSSSVALPLNLPEQSIIQGQETHMLHIRLEPGQSIRAESGSLVYMSAGVEMESSTGGGFSMAAKRFLTGDSAFVTDFINQGTETAEVGLAPDYPAKLIRLDLDHHGGSLICQRGAFLCSNASIAIELEFTRTFSAGFFGSNGFILQRLSGTGSAVVKAGGALIDRVLGPGEVLRIASGAVVAFETSVGYDVAMVKGVKNVLLGGEGLFLTTLTGPGKIWLQSLPFDRMAASIADRIGHRGEGPGMILPIGGGGGAATTGAGAGAATAGAGTGGAVDIGSSAAMGAASGATHSAISNSFGGGGGGSEAGSTGNLGSSPSTAGTGPSSFSSPGNDEFAPDVEMKNDLPAEDTSSDGGGGGGWFSNLGKLFGNDETKEDEEDDWGDDD